ncbi:hypothetical protein [Verminephrobacter eiseniae]|uniref:hypothetical protein n=1 Tax=Verminephrobacter eiseniae TaxID=364317 RepID=UPI0038B3C002
MPPHSPELNPQEHLWDGFRKKYFRNRVFGSIDALEDHPVVALRDLETPPSASKALPLGMRSLRHRPSTRQRTAAGGRPLRTHGKIIRHRHLTCCP